MEWTAPVGRTRSANMRLLRVTPLPPDVCFKRRAPGWVEANQQCLGSRFKIDDDEDTFDDVEIFKFVGKCLLRPTINFNSVRSNGFVNNGTGP